MSSMEEKRRALQAIGLKKVGVVVCVHSNEATALRVHCILVFRASSRVHTSWPQLAEFKEARARATQQHQVSG
jgi:hypothetical protein